MELLLYATPSFFLAAMLVLVFSNELGWLPPGGLVDLRLATPTVASYATHLVLPVITVALLTTAGYARFFAQSVHEELGRDYVRTALSKGASFPRAVLGHVFPQRACARW